MIAFKMVMLVMTVMTGSALWAQEIPKTVFEASDKMFEIGNVKPCEDPFHKELDNTLAVNNDLYLIKKSKDSVTVAALVNNKNGGDYSKYWNGKNTTTRYTWVFIPSDFMNVCKNKGITSNGNANTAGLSRRLCRLLGLSDIDQRDTIIYMNVPRDSLFRPAYNPDISSVVTEEQRGQKKLINLMNASDRNWMAQQQNENTYPWTRMGYTFDWEVKDLKDWKGKKEYIGVSEFIIRPNTHYSNLRYIKIQNLNTDQGLDEVFK